MTDSRFATDEDDVLAAEYVIGLLDAVTREAATKRLRADTGFATRVSIWETYLEDLNEGYGTQTPPAWVKTSIDRRLFGTGKRRRPGWVLLGLVSAAVLLAMVMLPQIMTRGADLQAQLAIEGSPYVFSVAVDLDSNHIEMAVVTGDRPQDGTFELWLIPEGGVPRSLGTFASGERLAILPDVVLAADATLAISVEPTGGSPTGAPTGPVVAVGALQDV